MNRTPLAVRLSAICLAFASFLGLPPAMFPRSGSALLATRAFAAAPPILPDKQKTPGNALDVTKEDVCVPGYSKKVRNVPESLKRKVYNDYGIAHRQPKEYEVDHLISLELGGSNSQKNLWPESYITKPWNAHVKDQLENALHRDVCDDALDLKTAQREIATDWIAAYKKRFHTQTPLADKDAAGAVSSSHHAVKSVKKPSAVAAKEKVWVNLKSGIYWRPGTARYGKTEKGALMTEAEALKKGYRAAGSKGSR